MSQLLLGRTTGKGFGLMFHFKQMLPWTPLFKKCQQQIIIRKGASICWLSSVKVRVQLSQQDILNWLRIWANVGFLFCWINDNFCFVYSTWKLRHRTLQPNLALLAFSYWIVSSYIGQEEIIRKQRNNANLSECGTVGRAISGFLQI